MLLSDFEKQKKEREKSAPKRTRTSNHLVRSQVLYPIELSVLTKRKYHRAKLYHDSMESARAPKRSQARSRMDGMQQVGEKSPLSSSESSWGLVLSAQMSSPQKQIGKLLGEEGIWLVALNPKKMGKTLQSLDWLRWSCQKKGHVLLGEGTQQEVGVWRQIQHFDVQKSFWSPESGLKTAFWMRLLKLMHQIPCGALKEVFIEQIIPKSFLKFVLELLSFFEERCMACPKQEQKWTGDLCLCLMILKTLRALGCLDGAQLQHVRSEASTRFLHENLSQEGFTSSERDLITLLLYIKSPSALPYRELMEVRAPRLLDKLTGMWESRIH